MLNNVKKSVYFNHITSFHKMVDAAQWTDQYRIIIRRIKPDESTLVENIDDAICFIKEIEYQQAGISLTTQNIGSGYMNSQEEPEPATVSITFWETNKLAVKNFLHIDNLGNNILPQDGTYLLPYDYYFHIEYEMLDASWNRTSILSGDFLLESQVSIRQGAEGGAPMEKVYNFKPIISSSIIIS